MRKRQNTRPLSSIPTKMARLFVPSWEIVSVVPRYLPFGFRASLSADATTDQWADFSNLMKPESLTLCSRLHVLSKRQSLTEHICAGGRMLQSQLDWMRMTIAVTHVYSCLICIQLANCSRSLSIIALIITITSSYDTFIKIYEMYSCSQDASLYASFVCVLSLVSIWYSSLQSYIIA